MWMITGDKPETAVAIGRMCGLVTPEHDLEMMVNIPKGESLRLHLTEIIHFFDKKRILCPDEDDASSVWSALSRRSCNIGFFSWKKVNKGQYGSG